MIGIFIITGASWLLFYYLLKKNLFNSWFLPVSRILHSTVVGIGILLFSFGIPLLLKDLIYSLEWIPYPDVNLNTVANAFWFYTKSVLTEELIFRGAFLSILAHYVSEKKSILFSAFCFGVYHWFSYGMFGSGLIPMLYVLLLTGSFGLVWGYMYLKTGSIVLPTIFHLGWNFSSSLFYDYQPFGELLFKINRSREFGGLEGFLIQFGLEILAILIAFGLFKIYQTKKAD